MPIRSAETPLGWISLKEENEAITTLTWGREGTDETPLLVEAVGQLTSYFSHDLNAFDLPLCPSGGAFQQAVNAAKQASPMAKPGNMAKSPRS
ncbi:MAG: hypothetical protein ACRBM6_05055 [Geminicoccales bacterium]